MPDTQHSPSTARATGVGCSTHPEIRQMDRVGSLPGAHGHLQQDFFRDAPPDVREAKIPSCVPIGETAMVNSE
jgi:hypothetical protein